MKTPLEEAIKSIEEAYDIEIDYGFKEIYLAKEKKVIKFSFVAGFASPQSRLTGTCAERYYQETFKPL